MRRSTVKKGVVTHIVTALRGTVLTDLRTGIHIIATEFIVADLKGRSLPETARKQGKFEPSNFQRSLEKRHLIWTF